ncbi:MAG: zf-HC2 domain-containing protein [Gemmatimonadetes bacterium]|nr:zf-HC2 domain-containing protein [Gemmatimonadota bacterium]
MKAATEHLSDTLLQDYAEGVVSGAELAAVEAHLVGCTGCRSGVAGWRALLANLGELPRLAPSAAFADQVMARVKIRTPLAVRVLAWVRSLFPFPATPRTWALATAAAMVPVAIVGGAAYWVFSYPGVTPGNVLTFLVWRAGDAVGGFVAQTTTALLESRFVLPAYTILEALARSPGAAVATVSTFSALTALALWVLYRNVFTARSVDGRHAAHLFAF